MRKKRQLRRHEESTHAAGVAPIDQPEKWDVQLERGSNAVAAKLLTLLESGEKSAAKIAEALVFTGV